MEDRRNMSGRRPANQLVQPLPFWSRMRSIALFPLQGAALWSLIALTLCSLLTLLPGIGWLLNIVVALATYRYAFEVLRHTANGHAGAPDYGLDLDDGAIWRMFALFLLAIFAVMLVAAFTRSGALTLMALAAVVLLLPGSVISLAIDGSLLRALNPAVPLAMATRIGWPYLAAFCLLFVIFTSSLMAAGWLKAYMPPLLGELTINFAVTWGLFSVFHLLGYLVYQYHEALGFEPEALSNARPQDPDQRLLDEAETLVRDGHTDNALETLRGAVRSRAVTLPVHELYQRLLRQSPRRDELHEHSRQYLSRLLAEKQERRALAVLREALDQDAEFVPAQIEQATVLLDRARLGGQYQLTADALRAMLHAWPRAAEAGQWSLELSLLLAERFGRDEEAREILALALQRCEDDEQRRRLQAAQAALLGLAGGTAPA
ncbi:MAG TPA: DUF4013 domain-containing protein [Stenotrophomonas sp.]|jgi:hypothetical protein